MFATSVIQESCFQDTTLSIQLFGMNLSEPISAEMPGQTAIIGLNQAETYFLM